MVALDLPDGGSVLPKLPVAGSHRLKPCYDGSSQALVISGDGP